MNEFIRASSVPALLIAAGALFLTEYQGGWRVGESWPALLIVGGVMRVLDHLTRAGRNARAE